jgi:type II secretory pathway pseudopilin PulG
MQRSDCSTKKRKRGVAASHPRQAVRDKDGTPLFLEAALPGRARGGERGYVLLAVLFLAVMILILLAVAAPKVAADIERDREVELMHRGMQYRRAIQLYYRKFGAYPPNMEALEKTNQVRFLRKRYRDPITGKDEWHLIHFGENKSPTVMGFFGQAMGGAGGSTLAGTGPGGVGQNLGAGLAPSNFGGGIGGGVGGSSIGGSSIGGSSFNSGGSNGLNGLNGSTGSVGGTNGGSDPNAGNPNSGTGITGTGNLGTGQGTGSSDPNSPGGTNGSASSSFMSGSNSNGQTFGGGGIIGIESTSPKATILEYKKKKHFNEWEFVYDPASERTQVSGNLGTVGQPMSGAGNSPSMNSPSLNGGNPNLPNGGQPITPPTSTPDGNQPNPQ